MRAMMKEAVGQRAAQTLMEEHEQQCDFHALGGEAVGVVCTVALEQSVGSHLTQVIAQLVKLSMTKIIDGFPRNSVRII